MVSAKVCRSFQGMFFTHFSVETIPTRFCWLTCRKQNAVQSEISQRELFVPISRFWQFGQVSVYYFMSILITCKCWPLHLSSSLCCWCVKGLLWTLKKTLAPGFMWLVNIVLHLNLETRWIGIVWGNAPCTGIVFGWMFHVHKVMKRLI